MPIYVHKCDCCGKRYETEHQEMRDMKCKQCGMFGIRRDWTASIPAIGYIKGAGNSKPKPSGGNK